MPTPPRSRDRLDDDHMTAEVHRRWGGELIYDELLLSCDRRQDGHVTSEG